MAKRYGLPDIRFSTDDLRPEAMLFALHAYYSLLARLLLGQVVGQVVGGSKPDGLDLAEVFTDDPFSQFFAAPSETVNDVVDSATAAMARCDPAALAEDSHGSDLLGPLYQQLVPRPLRHELGEYYTPDWLADHVLDVAEYSGDPKHRLLDPACGSGTFLLRAIQRIRSRHAENEDQTAEGRRRLYREILGSVAGIDLNPVAVTAARVNYLIAIADLLPHSGRVDLPIRLGDSILDDAVSPGNPDDSFDFVVGNPPWIAWDNLPDDYRRATKPLWERYGLFTLSGNEARHGGGKKDLAMLMTYAAADRYLRAGGRLAMVITQTVFQTKAAGDGFRRFRLGSVGPQLGVLRVDDMAALRPFPGATNLTATFVLQKDSATQYPVPYVKWMPDGNGYRRQQFQAQPIDPSRSGSPWLVTPADAAADPAKWIGPSDYSAHLGANSGGANGVYWVDVFGRADGGVSVQNLAGKGKRTIETVRQVIEPDLLHPLLRWGDVTRFRAAPGACILLAQDVETRTGVDETRMLRDYPRTYAYLQQFRGVLEQRAAYRRYQAEKPFYSMYNVGPYTVAPVKVVWRRMDRRINAAVVEQIDHPVLGRRVPVPQETCVLIACDTLDEAHYVCAVLNGAAVDSLVAAHSVRGGKGFGTPGMLDFIKLARFDPNDSRHSRLAALSRQAHRRAAEGLAYDELQDRIDQLTGNVITNTAP